MAHLAETQTQVFMERLAWLIPICHAFFYEAVGTGLAHIMDENGEYRMTSGTKLPLKCKAQNGCIRLRVVDNPATVGGPDDV